MRALRFLARQIGLATVLGLGALSLIVIASGVNAQTPKDTAPSPKSKGKGPKAKTPAVKLGLHINDAKAFQGYTLIAPMMSKNTYLVDMKGRVVRMWESDCTPALSAYLLPNGNLLRPGAAARGGRGKGGFGGPVLVDVFRNLIGTASSSGIINSPTIS